VETIASRCPVRATPKHVTIPVHTNHTTHVGAATVATVAHVDAGPTTHTATQPGVAARVVGTVDANAPYGVFRGVDGRHGNATVRDAEIDKATGKKLGELEVVIPRRMDPEVHGTQLAAQLPVRFGEMLGAVDNSMEVEAFYQVLEAKLPPGESKIIDESIAAAKKLAAAGFGPPIPNEKIWRRSLVQAYLHSMDLQTVMTAVGFPPGDSGAIVGGLAWIEKAVNFLQHHMPREHFGVRHLPRGEWANLEHALETDPAINHSEVGKQICRDAAKVWQALELEGKVIPWQKLKKAEVAGVNDAAIQRSFETLQSQNTLGDKMYVKHDASLTPLLRDGAELKRTVRTGVEQMRATLRDPTQQQPVLDGSLLADWQSLSRAATTKNEKAAVAALGEVLAARTAQVSVVDAATATKMCAQIDVLETALAHDEPQYFPVAELLRSIDVMDRLPDVIKASKAINDDSAALVYGQWIDIWKNGFPFPNVVNGDLDGHVAMVSVNDAPPAKVQKALKALDGDGDVRSKLKKAFPGVDPEVVLRDYLQIDPGAKNPIKVNVSALGPFGTAMIIWGDSREDANAIMDPHRLSPHHNGNSDHIEDAPEVSGKHDILEFAPLTDVQQQMTKKFFPQWFGSVVAMLEKVGNAMLADAEATTTKGVALNPAVTPAAQRTTWDKVFQLGKQVQAEGKLPVIVLDHRLSALDDSPIIKKGFAELVSDVPALRDVDAALKNGTLLSLPGYTAEASDHWRDQHPALMAAHPDLFGPRGTRMNINFMGYPLTDANAMPGLAALAEKFAHETGGKLIFAGQGTGSQAQALSVYTRSVDDGGAGLVNPDVRFGQAGRGIDAASQRRAESMVAAYAKAHPNAEPVELDHDSVAKAEWIQQIERESVGGKQQVVVAFADDRAHNRFHAQAASSLGDRLIAIRTAAPGLSFSQADLDNPHITSTFDPNP
jgi:hypothetical protein